MGLPPPFPIHHFNQLELGLPHSQRPQQVPPRRPCQCVMSPNQVNADVEGDSATTGGQGQLGTELVREMRIRN